jgi:hypothetical protein
VALFGWRSPGVTNIADKDSPASAEIARSLFESLGVVRKSTEKGQTLGSEFEKAVADFLREALGDTGRPFEVGSERITAFTQYRHLARLTELVTELDPGGTLRAELGTDYLIKPDVTVGLRRGGGEDVFLHAAVSCKWTIRSDRVQNIRHEGVILGRHRRGRAPHIVTVTCEPLASRLAAIARGTGEVDCVYHAALDELTTVLESLAGSAEMRLETELDTLQELTEQDRLRSLEDLPAVLAEY